MDVVPTGTSSYSEAFNTYRYADTALGEIEAERARRHRFTNIKWQMRPRTKVAFTSRDCQNSECGRNYRSGWRHTQELH